MGAFLQTLTSCLVWIWSLLSCGRRSQRGPSGPSCDHKEGHPLPLGSASTKSNSESGSLCLFMYVLDPGLRDHRQIGTQELGQVGWSRELGDGAWTIQGTQHRTPFPRSSALFPPLGSLPQLMTIEGDLVCIAEASFPVRVPGA